MHVSTYSTYPRARKNNWEHRDWRTRLPVGPEAALTYLCAENSKGNKNGDALNSPLSHTRCIIGGQDCHLLLHTWFIEYIRRGDDDEVGYFEHTAQSQWYELTVFSAKKLSQRKLAALVAECRLLDTQRK